MKLIFRLSILLKYQATLTTLFMKCAVITLCTSWIFGMSNYNYNVPTPTLTAGVFLRHIIYMYTQNSGNCWRSLNTIAVSFSLDIGFVVADVTRMLHAYCGCNIIAVSTWRHENERKERNTGKWLMVSSRSFYRMSERSRNTD